MITPGEVSVLLGRLDVPGILARYLSDPVSARPAAVVLAGLLPRILATVEDGRARRVASRIIPRVLGGAGAGVVVARALRTLVEGGRHQEMFGFILEQMKTLLGAQEETLRTAIEERVREQGGRLIGWALGASIARRVLTTITTELDKMSPDGSELRAAFDEWIRREINRMEEDPARAKEIGAAIRKVVAHETVQAWLWDVWSRLRLALEADAARPSGRTVAYIEGALSNFGVMLLSDPGTRARVEAASAGITNELLPAARDKLSAFIAQVVGGGHEDDCRPVGVAGGEGPAIRADEWDSGGVCCWWRAVRGVAGWIWTREFLTSTGICPAAWVKPEKRFPRRAVPGMLSLLRLTASEGLTHGNLDGPQPR